MQLIRQAVTKESLFTELQQWCKKGAGHTRDRFLIMSAFATGSGVEALEPFFDIFLADGNSIEVVIGIDRNGTNREAVARFFALQESYLGQFSCHVFRAPSNIGIFHPKLYLHRSLTSVSAIVGSANLTLGGLGNNFESLFVYRDIPVRSMEVTHLMDVWNTYAAPKMPLKTGFLRKLTRTYVRELVRTLPKSSIIEGDRTSKGVKAVWASVSRVKLPRSNERIQTQRSVARVPLRAFLLIDVLTETRRTQMQLPLAVVEKFFRFAKDQEGSIQLSYIRGGQVTQPIERKIVISSGNKMQRLMRRIEMPQIAARPRPLAAIFYRLAAGKFAVALVPKATKNYKKASGILDVHGQQPDHARRRYYIGSRTDSQLQVLRPMLAPAI
jgi:hypothetical protein